MIELNIIKLYENLAKLNEAKSDIDNFIDKFGEETYDLFKRSTQRLKNKGVSTDLTYHVKHTDKKDLDAILTNLQNRVITKNGNLTELDGDYEYLGEGRGYKVYKINDVVAAINLGAGTGWCISGRYGHYGEENYKPSKTEAEKHWRDYAKQGVQFYFFIGNKDKIALALYPKPRAFNYIIGNAYVKKTNCEVYDERDKFNYGLLPKLPVNLIDRTVVFEGEAFENGLYIKDNKLISCDTSLKDAVIPDGVTSISKRAFFGCHNLTSITIGNSVSSIGEDAFFNCISLTSIKVGENNQSYKAIDGNLYTKDGATLIQYAIGKTETSFVIPDSVKSIGEKAFEGCSSLTNITIPDSVTSIRERAFLYCKSLTSVTIGNSVTSIGNSTFYYCSSLTSITIPDRVTSIGSYAFSNCSSLTSITIPDSVTRINTGAFANCPNLTNIQVSADNPKYKSIDGKLYTKDGNPIKLNESKADIDNFISKFGEETYDLFKRSTQRLKNKGIPTDLIYHVKHTTKKDLDAILINLQNRAITKDNSLTELAGDYEYLGEGKGYKVYKINDVIASINLGSDTGWCISGRYGHYGEINYKPSKTEAERHWRDYAKQGAQFYFFIGNKGKVALAIYPKVINLDKLNGLNEWGEWDDEEERNEHFRIVDNTYIEKTNCEIYTEQDKLDYHLLSSLPINLVDQTVVVEGHPLKNGLYIKDNNLIKCVDKNLKNVVIPNGVTSIGKSAFQDCTSLTSITIPDSVESIGHNAFDNCNSLTSVTIGNSVTTISSYAFNGCESLKSIIIPNSVKSIGAGAFDSCCDLTNITIPNSVTKIDKFAFCACSSLKSVTIPDSVTSIGDYAFYSCDNLTSVTIGKNVTSIGKWTFFNCDSLTSITIGRNVRSIGDNAFKGCHSLTNIIVDKNNPNYKVVDGHLYDKDDEMIV